MIKRLQSLTIALALFFCSAAAQDSLSLQYSKYITGTTIQKHLSVLASDSLEGRETAKPGMEKAANYVASQFASFGFPPIVNNSYFQPIPLINYSQGTYKLKVANKALDFGNDFYYSDLPPGLNVKYDEIVFAGYGIKDSVSGWNDYNGIDIKGKTVLILEGEPMNKKGVSLISKTKSPSVWVSNRSAKINLAKDMGAVAILIMVNDYAGSFDRYNRRMEYGRVILNNSESAKKIPIIYVSKNTSNTILEASGKTLEAVEKNAGKHKGKNAFTIKIGIEMNADLGTTSCRNVLGYVEGSDLKDEVIVISAHLDHLGKRGGKIYYGADDDGSGSSSILNIAEAFSIAKKEGHGPRRSILFINFSGEEKGLLGSEYYTDNPVFPLANTVVDLNIDMIGRVDTIQRASKNYTYLIGSDKLSSQLHTLNETSNSFCCNLILDYKYNDPSDKLKLYYRSDHYNFAKNNVPVIFYFTGLHEDYHKPTDTIDKIDFDKTAGIAKLVFNTAWELANRNDRIVVDVVNDFKAK